MSYIETKLISLNSRVFLGRRMTTITVCCLYILTISACRKGLVEANEIKPTHFLIQVPAQEKTMMRGTVEKDTLRALIALPGQSAKLTDTANYSFSWTSISDGKVLSKMPYLTINDLEKLPVNRNSLLLTVKEKSTGLIDVVNTSVFITTPTREGWVILGEKSGAPKIGMLAYTTQGYKKYTDVNTALGKNIIINGKPVSISTIGSDQPLGWSKLQWIGLATDQEVKMISSMDMTVDAGISQTLTQFLAPASNSIVLEKTGFTSFLSAKQNDVYQFNIYDMKFSGVKTGQLMNITPPAGPQKYRASSVNIQSGPGPTNQFAFFYRILYDLDNYNFVWVDTYGSTYKYLSLQLPFSLVGFQPMAIRNQMGLNNENDLIFTLLHNPTTKDTYLIQFLTNGILKSAKKISFTEAEGIINSRFIEIDYTTGYVVYVKGSSVFAYDPATEQSFELINFGNNVISLIKFVKYNQRKSIGLPDRDPVYNELFKRLIVCTYDPTNPDNTGTFNLYQTLLGHQPPVLETKESGFPKIVDTDFVTIH